MPGYYNDVAPMAVQTRDLGITVPLLGGDGWESPKLLETGGKALEGGMTRTTITSTIPRLRTEQPHATAHAPVTARPRR